MLDTAGRLHVNEELMLEVAAVREAANPHQTLLVADAMTGQDAVNVAKAFGERAGVTGIVLTRVDGDARGGAALSMRAITGKPIVLIGTGEKVDALETVSSRAHRRPHPRHGRRRQPGREGGRDASTRTKPRSSPRKMQKGEFDLDDLAGAAAPDPPHGRDERHARHAARDRQDQEAARRRQYRREHHQAPGGDHRRR